MADQHITITVEMGHRPPQTIALGADAFTFGTGHIKTFDYADKLLGEIKKWVEAAVTRRIVESKPDNDFLRIVKRA